MARYRYLAYDLRTNVALGALPLTDVSFGSVLNGAGSFSARLPMQGANVGRAVLGEGGFGTGPFGGKPRMYNPVRARELLDATEPLGRRALFVDRDGVLVWGGVLWTRDYDSASKTLDIGGNEFWSIFRSSADSAGRLVATDVLKKEYVGSDQLAIVRDLVSYSQAKPGGNLGIVVGSETCGVTRDVTIWGDEFKPIGQAVEELAELENGFDFAIDVRYASGVPQKVLTLSYPRRGRTAPNTGLVFRHGPGGNVVRYSWPEDGTKAANRGWTLGAGNPGVMEIGSYARPDRLDAGFPLLEAAWPYKELDDLARLNEHARADLDAVADGVTLPEITVKASADPSLGSYITGDDARVVMSDPYRFPDGLDEHRRIHAFTVRPEEDLVTITLGDI